MTRIKGVGDKAHLASFGLATGPNYLPQCNMHHSYDAKPYKVVSSFSSSCAFHCNCVHYYSPGCLGQETAKGPFGLRAKLPPAHVLYATYGGGFTLSGASRILIRVSHRWRVEQAGATQVYHKRETRVWEQSPKLLRDFCKFSEEVTILTLFRSHLARF